MKKRIRVVQKALFRDRDRLKSIEKKKPIFLQVEVVTYILILLIIVTITAYLPAIVPYIYNFI